EQHRLLRFQADSERARGRSSLLGRADVRKRCPIRLCLFSTKANDAPFFRRDRRSRYTPSRLAREDAAIAAFRGLPRAPARTWECQLWQLAKSATPHCERRSRAAIQ